MEVPVFTFVLVKLASRCNINCTYCYWFRDADVYKKPAVLSVESEVAFCQRLEEHIRAHVLDPEHGHDGDRMRGAEELIDVVRAYLK